MYRDKYWLWLTMVFGVGNERLWEVMRFFDDPLSAYSELVSGLFNDRLSEKEKEKIKSSSLEQCSEIIDLCNSKGYGVLSYSNPKYPSLLRHIYNPPAILYYDGDINVFSYGRVISIVGARNCSEKSLEIEKRLCRELALSGNTIASGFAVGADITAHMASVSVGKPTISVLGCGIDVNYPKENFQYRDKLKSCGVFITEFPLGTSPHPQNFPKRNRILAGISSGVIVVEAGEKSGSLITAELALQNGREVFCLPPTDIYDSRYVGNIKILRDGATAIYGCEDIRSYYRQFDLTRLELDSHSLDYVIEEIDDDIKIEKIPLEENLLLEENIDKIKKEKKLTLDELLDDEFTDLQKEIVTLLYNEGELHADIIGDKLETDMADLMSELTELELIGIIRSMPGKIYKLTVK